MAFTISLSIKDAKGNQGTTEFNFPSDYDFDDVVLFAQQAATRINALIKGAITRISLGYAVDLPAGLTATPDPNSDVEEGARFQFKTENGFYTAMRIPTFDEALLISGTKNVDLTDADVDDFVGSMVDGAPVVALGGVLSPSDKRDEDIASLEYAREEFQSSRAG